MLSNNPPIAARLTIECEALIADVDRLAERANAAPRQIRTGTDLDAVTQLVKDARALDKRVDAARVAEKEPYLTAGREVDSFFKPTLDRLSRIAVAFQRIADDHARAQAAEARRKAEEEAARARAEAQRQREIAERAAAAERARTAAKAEDRAAVADARAEEAERLAAAPSASLVGQTTTASGVTASGKAVWVHEITDYDRIPLDLLRPYLKREHVEAALRQFVKFNTNTKPLTGVKIFADVKASIR